MVRFVLNEWIWEDCRGANHGQKQREAFQFLISFVESDDLIVVVKESKFFSKWALLCKSFDIRVSSLAGLINARVLWDSNRCRLLYPWELADLAPEIAAKIKDDDHYLVKALIADPESILVTTDTDLFLDLWATGFECKFRDELILEYPRDIANEP